MRISDSALVSRDATCASAPRGTSAYAAIAVGIATFMIGTAAFAADAPATVSESQVGSNASAPAATSETATRETTTAAEAPANNAQSADAHPSDTAKGKKHGKDKDKKNTTTADEVVVEGKQPEQQQVCHKSQATGTRLRQTVCTSVAQQQANDKASEQQAQDYLRRMSQQGTLASPASSPYIQSGIP